MKTPLNGAMTPLEQCVSDLQEAGQIDRKNLNDSYRCIQLLSSTLNDIIDFTSILSHKFNLHYSCLNFQQYVYNLVEMIQDLVEMKQLKFICEIDKTLQRIFITDSQRLSQILLNLINNAIKFTERGEIKLQITMIQQDFIQFVVIDTGIGMSKDYFEKIQNLLENMELSSNLNINSTGICLGLSISQLLAKELGPQEGLYKSQGIQVKSEEGVGSQFSFIIASNSCEGIMPVNQPSLFQKNWEKTALFQLIQPKQYRFFIFLQYIFRDKQKSKQTYNSQSDVKILSNSSLFNKLDQSEECLEICIGQQNKIIKASKQRFSKQQIITQNIKKNILIVDDDGFNLNSLQLILTKKFNVTIEKAFNGQQALETVQKSQFDLILMDYQMPIMDGVIATQHIRKYYSDNNCVQIPIIACSAFDSTENVYSCLQSGMNEYIKKPITYDKLKNVFLKYQI